MSKLQATRYRDGRIDKKKLRARTRVHQEVLQGVILKHLGSHPCIDCGEGDPVVLEFDHVRGKKKMNVSRMVKTCGLVTLNEEIAKCDVRCANCHRRVTAKRNGNWMKTRP